MVFEVIVADDITKLIVRTAMKDRAAFDQLYTHTSAKLFGVCLRILNDRGEAEDALQEVFIKIWRAADTFAISDLSPISWLVAIARHQAIDRVRRRRPPAVDLEEAFDLADESQRDPEAHAIAASQSHQLGRCMNELEGERAAAVRGAYLDGLSYADLARRHNVPLNTMRTWLRRSLLRLKECLRR